MQLGFHFSNILLALRYSHIPIKVSPLEVYRYNSVVCVKQTQTTPVVQHLMNVDNVLHVQSSSKWLACYPLSGLLSITQLHAHLHHLIRLVEPIILPFLTTQSSPFFILPGVRSGARCTES